MYCERHVLENGSELVDFVVRWSKCRLISVSARSWIHQYTTLSLRVDDSTRSYISPWYSNSLECSHFNSVSKSFMAKVSCTSSFLSTPSSIRLFTVCLIADFLTNKNARVPMDGHPITKRSSMAILFFKRGQPFFAEVF